MPGESRSLRPHAFHEIAVAGDHVGEVIDECVSGGVESRGEVGLGHGHSHGHSQPLPEGAGCGFHTGRVTVLRMARSHASPLPEPSELVQRKAVTGQMQEGVKEGGTVTG